MRTPGKRVGVYAPRGFESHSLRAPALTIGAHLERWPSGRRRSPAKRVGGLNLLEGSNPSLSAKRHVRALMVFGRDPPSPTRNTTYVPLVPDSAQPKVGGFESLPLRETTRARPHGVRSGPSLPNPKHHIRPTGPRLRSAKGWRVRIPPSPRNDTCAPSWCSVGTLPPQPETPHTSHWSQTPLNQRLEGSNPSLSAKRQVRALMVFGRDPPSPTRNTTYVPLVPDSAQPKVGGFESLPLRETTSTNACSRPVGAASVATPKP